MKEIIRRLVEALEQYAPRDRAVTQDLIAGARKLLEGDALTQPADNDAWLEKAVDIAQEFDDRAFRADTEIQLRAHLRTRPAREGFVSVPVETLEAMRKDARLARLLADVRKKARDDALEGAALIADRAANVMPSAQQRAGAARVAVAIRVSALKDKPDGEQP